MPPKKPHTKPTAAELSLLQILWERGPSTVREIHDVLGGTTGYTTTLKILQKMAVKNIVLRDESQKTHVYRSASNAESTQRDLVGDLLRNAFGGRPGKLVIQALSNRRATNEELDEIRKLIDSMEIKNKQKSQSKRKSK